MITVITVITVITMIAVVTMIAKLFPETIVLHSRSTDIVVTFSLAALSAHPCTLCL